MDLGVAGDPNLEGVWKCISSSGVEIRHSSVLRINLDVVEWSKMLGFGQIPKVLDVCGHQRQGDHYMGLNVTCFAFSDELQIILKFMRVAEVLYNDLMNIWNPSMFHPII